MADKIKNLKYNEMKKEIEKFRRELIDYFKKQNHDVTLNQLIEDFSLSGNDINLLQYCLDKLVEEKWIKKSDSMTHFEYDFNIERGNE